ncbi:hypothetical protein BV378_25795 [Nostoc sp. RF31YmG]|nr:hypothetical protein BV378_25795 [Nostoc sp. RF31YmG]
MELAHPSEVISGNFSPDGRLIITASYDDTTRVWDLSGKLLLEIRGFYASFSSDGKYIITKLLDNTTRIWDFSGRQVAEFPYGFTDDGKQGISNEYGTIRVWQFAELDELLTQGCDWLQD